MAELRSLVARAGPSDSVVLALGETAPARSALRAPSISGRGGKAASSP